MRLARLGVMLIFAAGPATVLSAQGQPAPVAADTVATAVPGVVAVQTSTILENTSLGGVPVSSPRGGLLGTIPVSLQPQNIAFAGADKKTLYIVGRWSAFKVRLLAEG